MATLSSEIEVGVVTEPDQAQQSHSHRHSVREIGLVVAGAGARGAYEAGLLAHLIPEIAHRTRLQGFVPRFSFLGTSAGSLNSVLIASRAPSLKSQHDAATTRQLWIEAMTEVTDIWKSISENQVLSLLPDGRVLGALSRVFPLRHIPLVSAFNDDPLVALAQNPEVVDWDILHENVNTGDVSAVGAAVTGRDGRTVVFLHRHRKTKHLHRDGARDIDYVDVDGGLKPEHVLASSAIPAAFPPRRVDYPPEWAGWYYDGGVRLNTPLKPALALGLKHLLIVGTAPIRYDRSALPDPDCPVPEVDEALIPVVNQLMVDQLVQDIHTLHALNLLKPDQDKIGYVYAGPATGDTLANLARDNVNQPSAFRLLSRLLYGEARWETSSYLLFDKGYLGAALEAGYHRAAELDLDGILPGVTPADHTSLDGASLGHTSLQGTEDQAGENQPAAGMFDGFWRT